MGGGGAREERRSDLAEDARPRNIALRRECKCARSGTHALSFDSTKVSRRNAPRQLDSACYFNRGLRAIWETQSLSFAQSRQRGPVRSGQALSRDEILGCAVLSTVPRPALSRHNDLS